MPKVSLLQESFTGGEFSPLAQGQVSLERYRKAMNYCLNYVPTLQGALIRRPGTQFAAITSQSSGLSPALIPFVFSQTQAYMLEFGGQYIKFYAQNGPYVSPVANQYYIAGATNDAEHFFFATRPTYAAKGGETIVSSSFNFGGTIFQVPSPYLPQDVQNLKWAQNADTLYLEHPNYPTMKLQRFGAYDWRLAQVYFQDGPYLAYNSYSQTGDSTQISLQPTFVGLGSSAVAGLAGSSFSLQTEPQTIIAQFTQAVGVWSITTQFPHGYFNGQKIVIQNCSGVLTNFQLAQTYNLSTNSNSPLYYTINVTSPNAFQVIGLNGSSVVFVNTGSSANVYPALFLSQADVGRVVGLQQGTTNNAGQRVFGYITSWLGNAANVGFYLDQSNALFNTSTVIFWQLGCYGGSINFGGTLPAIAPFNGTSPGGSLGSSSFPSAACFHQDRLCFAGSPNYPQQIDGSEIANFENFAPSVALGSTALQVQTNNAFQFTLNSTDENKLQWLKSTAEGLLSASYSSEWVVTPGNQSTSISPSNVNAQQTSFFGSANIDAVLAGNAVLYVQRALRKVREMNFFFQVGTYRSTDMTVLAEHITLPFITKLVVQKETQPLVWGLTNLGQLVTMTYNRDDVTVEAGWARHQLGGRSDSAGSPPIVTAMASIPDPTNTYDQMWLITKRFLQNSTTNFVVEYMTNFFNDSMAQYQAVQGDCGATYDGPVAITGFSQSGIYTAVSFVPLLGGLVAPPGQFIAKIDNVIGVQSTVIDRNGIATNTSVLNGMKFQAFSSTVSTFYLQDFLGNNVSLQQMSAYVGSGVFRICQTSAIGATWLSGETVNVLADGANVPPVVVGSGGLVVVPFAAGTITVGYAFNSRGQLLRAAAGSAQGSAIGSTRRVNRAAFQLHDVGDFAYGMSFNNLIAWNFMQLDNNVPGDTAIPLFNGIIRDGIEAPYDFENMLCFQQNSMLPGAVVSITSFFEENDV